MTKTEFKARWESDDEQRKNLRFLRQKPVL